MYFTIQQKDKSSDTVLTPADLVIAGWAGRDAAAVEHHIQELQAIGVPAPSACPLFYRASPQQLTQSEHIQVVGENTAGEAEPFLFIQNGELFVSVGSDHTDRSLEVHSVALSKQICAKPVASTAWPFADIKGHWDELQLSSWIIDTQGKTTLYQQGRLDFLKRPEDLLYALSHGAALTNGFCMFGGTVPVIGTIRPAAKMRIELADPRLSRRIEHTYCITALPEVS